MGYPSELLTEDEVVLRFFRPHWRVLLAPAMWTAVAVAGLVVVWAVGDLARAGRLAISAGLALGWLAISLPPVARRQFTQYVLTNERMIVRGGIISRKGTEIPLENVNDVHFSQTPLERLLGYGDVIIESAGTRGQSHLYDIPRPEAFQAQVYAAREERSKAIHGNNVAPDPVAQLARLARLRDEGVITEDEFLSKKQRLLDQI